MENKLQTQQEEILIVPNVDALIAALVKPIAVATTLFVAAMVVTSMVIYERAKERSISAFGTVTAFRMNQFVFEHLRGVRGDSGRPDELCNQAFVESGDTIYITAYMAIVCDDVGDAQSLLDGWGPDAGGPPKEAALRLISDVMRHVGHDSPGSSPRPVFDEQYIFHHRVVLSSKNERLGVFLFAPMKTTVGYRSDFSFVVDVVLLGSVLLLTLWTYAYHTGRNEAKAAHSIRGRLATLGNAIDDPDVSGDGVKLSYYVEYVDAWIQAFLPNRSKRLPEASLQTIVDRKMLERTWDIVNEGLEPEKEFFVTSSGRASVAMREATAMMILDIVLDNARKFAKSRIYADIAEDELACWVSVEDDGPGMGLGKRLQVRMGFGRGLGLFILFQRAAQEGGSIKIARSKLGGVRIRIGLPRA